MNKKLFTSNYELAWTKANNSNNFANKQKTKHKKPTNKQTKNKTQKPMDHENKTKANWHVPDGHVHYSMKL